MTREKRKTDTLSLRIEPSVKEAIRTAADRERRSVASMIEIMALEYCRAHDMPPGTAKKRSAKA